MCDTHSRILFIAQDGFDLPTARVRCFSFARELANRGYSAETLSYRDDLHASQHGVNLPLMGAWEKLSLNLRALPRLLKVPSRSIFVLQKINYHCLAPWIVAALKRCKRVVDFDDLEYQLQRPDCWQNRVIRRTLRSADACVTGSHYLFDWMSAFNAKVYLVHTGVDTERFRPPSVERLQAGWLEAPVLTWSGGVFDDTTLDAARGVLAFFGELHSITPHVRLLLLAYGNYLPRLAKVIREQSAADCIELVTNTHPHEMPRWLSQAHAGIFYFPEITPWVRSKSPTKLFEYMACGVVPVCGRGSEADWVVTDGQDGILFDQVREGAERLAQVLESREHWTAMADRARQKAVNEFSLISQTNRLIDMFRELDRKEQ